MNCDCPDCPSHCCAYPIIPATVSDIRRFAKAPGLTHKEARDPEVCSSHPGDDCEWHDRRLLETMIKARPVIRLRVAPWTIDAGHTDHTAERRPLLMKACAKGDGAIPE